MFPKLRKMVEKLLKFLNSFLVILKVSKILGMLCTRFLINWFLIKKRRCFGFINASYQ